MSFKFDNPKPGNFYYCKLSTGDDPLEPIYLIKVHSLCPLVCDYQVLRSVDPPELFHPNYSGGVNVYRNVTLNHVTIDEFELANREEFFEL